jgi:N-acetylneuraminate synthase
MTPTITIKGRKIGPDFQPYIVAEMSGNHNGDLQRALDIVVIAKEAGADAIKLQTYTAATITIDHDGPGFRVEKGLWQGRTLYDLYQEAHTPWDWQEAIFAKADDVGITVFSSPFDATAIDFLERLGCPAYKIASFEAIDLPLIEYAAATGKPLVISTGLASEAEIGEAIAAARKAGKQEPAILHCISTYPTKPDDCNLRAVPKLADTFGIVVGFSDHTVGSAASVAAVALGASIIEKHLTIARADGGPDSAFSLEPHELKAMIADCREAFVARGNGELERPPAEASQAVFRRSLYVVEKVIAGEQFTARNVRSIRPGHGLPPKYMAQILGRTAKYDLERGTPLSWDAVNL